jgi:hypothetical protein
MSHAIGLSGTPLPASSEGSSPRACPWIHDVLSPDQPSENLNHLHRLKFCHTSGGLACVERTQDTWAMDGRGTRSTLARVERGNSRPQVAWYLLNFSG